MFAAQKQLQSDLNTWLVAAAFTAIGVRHFTHPEFFDRIVPPGLADLPVVGLTPRQATLLSGAAEVAGGLGLLHPVTRPAARAGLLALLVAVFPANIYMALNAKDFRPVPEWVAWARLPLQPVIGWAVWRTGRGRRA
ncbi:hypothetical protein Deipr_0028 [Deinococcus proteolyticus MRP]|uniref:DoxX family protein n=1 Tax=Deinococcus proteolyticus (strain ATCC 35074 / DSM 20540 / JCM 6276 / NBRC 101906 / NCIMB 13154 / VKM Ac-1939 / CCM 2703 / MRP) TaxID=693977 RepID=F0RIU8_DEIPM|nr:MULTISPECIES: hypothetical protein [Deinococcus]ADY25207.1 hypothetical protein Deipr_0028 [Deinococcus proteolyticus MRP]MCY1703305.1 hypothetical protein [Deinococcus sp. SL84]